MANRLQPLPVMSFVGGLNLRASQFELADNESPDMLNVDVDPRGGFTTRRGWQRWNQEGVVDEDAADFVGWEPRNGFFHARSNDTHLVYVARDHKLYFADQTGQFAVATGLVGNARPHNFDFADWGNDVYIATGFASASVRHRQPATGSATFDTLTPETYSEVDTPTANTMPQCEYVETHAGYLFCAYIREGGVTHPNRIRWSHPNRPDAFRADDYIDLEAFGGQITALVSFDDHLLIFKTNSMYALYGYDDVSWQLIRKSDSLGCPGVTATTRSENACYFYSAFSKGGVYAYGGGDVVIISDPLQPAFEQTYSYDNVFVSWANRRLWVSVPWRKDVGGTVNPTSVFLYDIDVGNGAWTMYRSDYGTPGRVLDRSDGNTSFPLATFWSENESIMVNLDTIDEAYDLLLTPASLGYVPTGDVDEPIGVIVTSLDEEIIVMPDVIGEAFDSYYRTGWLHAGMPDRKKSWRRPSLICRVPAAPVDLVLEVRRDYDETTVHRRRTVSLRPSGAKYWTPDGAATVGDLGFDWKTHGEDDPSGDGADWSAHKSGGQLQRAGSLGLAVAVQMHVSASHDTLRRAWGVSGIVAKYIPRRYR